MPRGNYAPDKLCRKLTTGNAGQRQRLIN